MSAGLITVRLLLEPRSCTNNENHEPPIETKSRHILIQIRKNVTTTIIPRPPCPLFHIAMTVSIIFYPFHPIALTLTYLLIDHFPGMLRQWHRIHLIPSVLPCIIARNRLQPLLLVKLLNNT